MKQILVIDDEQTIRTLLKKMLEREGFDVITASDGKEGMSLFFKTPVDLVITDLIMPEKEGIEIIGEIRKGYPKIPVIAISGGGRNAPDSYLNMARILGASAILQKPVDKETLVTAVKNALKL
jgi:DNA-binding NtrC family response regulator